MRRVEPIGPTNAKIMLIGEAPGETEEKLRKPFTGASGRLLDQLLLKNGIRRDSLYITNAIKVRPPGNKLDRLGELGLTKEQFRPELMEEIDRVRPNICILLGNTPLEFIAHHGQVTKWRGSTLSYSIKGREQKVIPTIHPAACMRNWTYSYFLNFDIQKAIREAEFPELKRMEREYLCNPTYTEVIEHLNRMEAEATHISLDLETYMKTGLIRCIGLGDAPNWAISIPILRPGMKPAWSHSEEVTILTKIHNLLTNPSKRIIAQNATFEMSQMSPLTGGKMNIWMCTMRAHALLYPEFPHGLDFLTSIYTDVPYYKDEGKVGSDKGTDYDSLLKYNCKDVAVTFEVALELERELKEIGMWRYYCEYENPLMHALWRIQCKGVKIDVDRLAHFKEKMDREIEELKGKITDSIGYYPNPRSNKQMCQFLYNDLGLPPKYKRGKKNPTTDEEALKQLYAKYGKEEIKDLLTIRQLRTLRETFLQMKLSADGRIRTSYGTTKTGRLSSSANLLGEGANLQNIPKRKGKWIREIFIPDKGKVWWKADLSQAEARIVAWCANDLGLKNIFNSGEDVHKLVASWAFNVPIEEVTTAQRNISKNTVHAMSYDTGPQTFAKEIEKPVKEAKRIMGLYEKTFPNIKGVYHRDIQAKINKNRTLETPFGRKRMFIGRWGPDLFREAYNYIPQSTVGQIINIAILQLEYKLPEGADMLIQVHDEICGQCYEGDLPLVYSLVKKAMEIPININGEPLTIPTEFETGPNWSDTKLYEGG